MDKKLIFDLGFLNGEDSSYYISKGYRVVAVEANPLLCTSAKERFKKELESGDLIICNKAIYEDSSSVIDFYINEERNEVSSTQKWIAGQNDSKVKTVKVETMNLSTMIVEFGEPHYVKVDIEGMDKEISRQMPEINFRPEYVSFELNKTDYSDIFMNLKLARYKEFQIINQIHNNPNCSGDFGAHLPDENWISFEDALSRYIKYRELKIIDNVNLGVGWVDLHARM